MQPWAERVVADGWVHLVDLGDAMESQDPRVYSVARYMEAACAAFELPIRFTMSKPRNQHSDGVLYASLSVMDAAALMVQFQSLGFEVDPAALISLLAPKLAAQDRFSVAELEVMFHSKNVDRSRLLLCTKPPPVVGKTEKFKTAFGHRVEWSSRDGHAILDVRGPKFRPRKPRVEHTCDYCGYTYTKGDLDAAIEHRRQHRRHRHSMDPRPLSAVARRLAEIRDGDIVTATSPKWMHKEVYERAVMFKREMEYDFIQWGLPPKKGRPREDGIGYLLAEVNTPSTIVGACAFRERSGTWTMDWAWLAPKYRRRGVMQRYWHRFVEAFGDFPLEYPLSEAMREFVLKHGTAAQRERLLGDLHDRVA